MDIAIDRESDKPLYVQIRDSLLSAIRSGSPAPGDQLPTVTALASKLGVTQTTIRRAYEDLIKEEAISSHVGRGTFVCDPRAIPREAEDLRISKTPPTAEPLEPEFRQAARRFRADIAKSLDNLLALQQRPGLISFTVAMPGESTLDKGVLEKLTRKALDAGPDLYRNYCEPAGLAALREALAERLSAEGVAVNPEMVLITAGAQQAMSLISHSCIAEPRRIICETPCYNKAPGVFETLGHWVESVPRDREGPLPDRMARFSGSRPFLLYLCPQLHNPMGTDLSAERRAMLLNWARGKDLLIISDEIFKDLRFEGPSPPSLLTEFGPGRTLLIGSFSKSFMPGLRIGWLISDSERVRHFTALKRTSDMGCPSLTQGIALALLETGEYENHLERVRQIYRRRRDALLNMLQRHMPEGVTWTQPAGGFNLWVELPAGFSSIALYLLALEHGVSFIPGPFLDLDHRFVNAFRLSYGDVEPEQIQEGIELLASAVKKLLLQPAKDLGLSGLGDFL